MYSLLVSKFGVEQANTIFDAANIELKKVTMEYMILYIIMNLMSYIDGIKYLSPLHYIVVASSNSSQIMFSTILFSIYAICVGILFTHIGIRKIEKMDL